MTTDQNGNRVTKNIQQEIDGTWSRNVWSGTGCVTNIQRRTGYRTRRAAGNGDISETAERTNAAN